jgi:arylsulfatase A-like enzyme
MKNPTPGLPVLRALALPLACLLLGSGYSLPTAAAGSAGTRPNIVLLVADDWGFSDVGAFGGEIATPHIDALAQRGTRFSNFHIAASCSPSRAMLLTGVDNHRNGVGNLREAMPREHLGQPGYQGSLNKRVVTVATLLRDGGYRTYASGKWNVGSEPYNRPDQRGFDRSIVQGDTGSDNWEPAKRYLPVSAKVDWFEDGQPAVMPAQFYSSQYFVDRAIGFIESGASSGKPFFTYLAFQANHVPVQAPRELIDKYKGRYNSGWGALRQARRDKAAELGLIPKNTPMASLPTVASWDSLSDKEKRLAARQMEVYAAMAEAMDLHVGRLVAHLKASGEFDNTVFVFLSDNGAEGSDYAEGQLWLATQYSQDIERLGGKGGYSIPGPGWASASVSPLNTYKFYAGEGGIRVPLIISGVRGMPQGQIHHGLTHVNDITPTLLALADVPRPGNNYRGQAIEVLGGASLLPALHNAALPVHAPDKPIGYEMSGNLALFKGDLKIVKNLPPMGDGQWHLYNLRDDPGETRDLQLQLPEAFLTMQADYAEYARTHGVLAMPEGYEPTRQITLNSLRNYWLPTYGASGLTLLASLLAGAGWLLMRRRQRRRAG